jgi:5-methylcytosine-specific restriction endonuclease McrA
MLVALPGTNTTTPTREIVMPAQRTTLPHTCAQCGAVYFPTLANLRAGAGRFCSLRCAGAARRLPSPSCPQCGKRARVGRIYCSWACMLAVKGSPLVDDNKRCSKCRETKPLSEFGPSPKRRYGLRSQCRQCLSLRGKARYAANREHVNAIVMRWRDANRDHFLGYLRSYHAANPEIGRAKEERRRARKAGAAVNDFTAAQWKEAVALQGGRCSYCWARGVKLVQEHITPLSRGGDHTALNITPSCEPCNRAKYTLGLLQFLRKRNPK